MAVRPIWAGYLALGAAIIAAIWLAVVLGERSAIQKSAPASTAQLAKRARCRQIEVQLEQLGVAVTDSKSQTVAKYDDEEWEDLDQDDKIQQALMLFCAKAPDGGHYTVLIQGRHHGKTLAHVVDGKYSEE